MSTVAVDPERLLALQGAIRRAADALAAIRNTDPAAVEALTSLADIRVHLIERWDPAIRRVLDTGALVDGVFAGEVPVIDLDLDLDHLIDDSELAALLVEWAATPAMPGELRARWDDAEWARLADALGAERLEVASELALDPDDPVAGQRLEDLDVALLAVASMYGGGVHAGHVRWRPTVLDLVSPMTAALMLPGFELDDIELGEVAARVVARDRDQQPDGTPWPDRLLPGDDAGDLVFTYLVTRPGAAGAFLDIATDRPELVFLSADHDDSVAALLIAGTDPTFVDATTAGARLVPLITWARDHEGALVPGDGVVDDPPAVLAGAVAPWLLQFGPRAAEWGWDEVEGDASLGWIMADDTALATLADALDRWQLAMAEVPLLHPDGRVDLDRLLDLTATIDQVARAVRDAQLDDAAADRFFAEAGVFVGSLFVSAIVPGGIAASMAGDAALAVVVPAATAMLARWGLMPSADDDAADTRAGFGSWLSNAAVSAVVAYTAQAIVDGRLPANALDALDLDDLAGDCRTDEVHDRLWAFVHDTAGRTDPATGNGLIAVLGALMNEQTVDVACAR